MVLDLIDAWLAPQLAELGPRGRPEEELEVRRRVVGDADAPHQPQIYQPPQGVLRPGSGGARAEGLSHSSHDEARRGEPPLLPG